MTLEELGIELAWARALGAFGHADERLRGGRLYSRFEAAKAACQDKARVVRAEEASCAFLKRLLN